MPASFVFLFAVAGLAFGVLFGLAGGWLFWGRKAADAARLGADLQATRDRLSETLPAVAEASSLRADLAAARAASDERERGWQEAAGERQKQHEQQMRDMRGEFERLAAAALEQAQKRFTEQAEETLKLHRSEAARGLSDNREALAKLVDPMRETLGRYGEELKALEAKREQAYGSLSEQLQSVAVGQQAVKEEAGRLVAALRSSARASGAWGEAQLQNVLEMAGLHRGIDFELQESSTTNDGRRQRPDAVLKLPGGRELIVDSKCSLADYLAASEAESEAARLAALKRHAQAVRAHARGLGDKAYWQQWGAAADFVVMFLPGENFLSAALEHDLDLLAWCSDRRILLAGPTNLLAIARVVAMVWRQERMAEEARAIGALGAELYGSLCTMADHIQRLGRNIRGTTESYNQFLASLETRVLTKARRFPELGVNKGGKDLPELAAVEQTIRPAASLVAIPAAPAAGNDRQATAGGATDR